MNKALDVLGKIVCSILVVILFGMLSTYYALVGVTSLAKEENIKTVITGIDYKKVLQNSEGNALEEYYKGAEEAGLSRETADQILEDEEIKEFVSDAVYGYINYAIYGEEESFLTSDKINEFISKKFDEIITDDTKLHLDGKTREQIKQELMLDEEESRQYDEGIDKYKKEVGTVHTKDFNTKSLSRSLFTTIMVIVVIIMLCRWSLYKWMAWIGPVCISAGFMPLLIGSLGKVYINPERVAADLKTEALLLDKVLPELFNGFFRIGFISITIGIALLIIHHILKKNDKSSSSFLVDGNMNENDSYVSTVTDLTDDKKN
jgi:hypothetical protein